MFEAGKRYTKPNTIDKLEFECIAISGDQVCLKYSLGGMAIWHRRDFSRFKEVKPKIKREVWMAHRVGIKTDWSGYMFPTKERAVSYIAMVRDGRHPKNGYDYGLAVTGPYLVEFEEGEGLS